MAVQHLPIREQWIRQRVQLQHSCLADVRSLCLPGTYEGKIRHLGNSLKNFSRLKSLDLSHNALVSVEGLQHLQMLEELNLYYNCLPSLREVLVLCKLKALKELDLRLNPLVKNHPDYRLYLVHALSELRRLDDCPVRDRERKASIMHFSSDMKLAPQQTSSFPPGRTDQRNDQPRIATVNRLTRNLWVFDNYDEALLNMVANSNTGLSETPALTGPTSKRPESHLYDFQEHQTQSDVPPSRCGIALVKGDTVVRGREGTRVTFADPTLKGDPAGPHGAGQKGVPFRVPVQGNFTPTPACSSRVKSIQAVIVSFPGSPPSPSKRCPSTLVSSSKDGPNPPERLVPRAPVPRRGGPDSGRPVEGTVSPCVALRQNHEFILDSRHEGHLYLLLDLVDKHWTGRRSLQRNQKFLTGALQIFAKMEEGLLSQPEDGRSCSLSPISHRIMETSEEQSLIQNLSQQLEQAQSSVEESNQLLKTTLEENLSLQKQLIKLQQMILRNGISGAPELIETQTANGSLKSEVEELREKLGQAGKAQKMAERFQESHKSLVSTNKHLLAELEETKARHRAELEQLQFGFDELRKNVSLASRIG